MKHVREIMSNQWRGQATSADPGELRRQIGELAEWRVSDEVVSRHGAALSEYVRQRSICEACTGYVTCGKEGDMRGFVQHLSRDGDQLVVEVKRCGPFLDHTLRRRVERWSAFSGTVPEDAAYRFENFPDEQRQRYPRLLAWAETFASTYSPSERADGVYLFGPPGVGKTHLVLSVINRLQERAVPSLFIRSDSLFDRMRHVLAAGGDLEPVLEAYGTAPVLAIDEFAQERANEFTLEKLFRIVNQRFHAGLPTLFTSNYAPPHIYRRDGRDVLETVAPLRSRVLQMAQLARMEGVDARQSGLRSLT